MTRASERHRDCSRPLQHGGHTQQGHKPGAAEQQDEQGERQEDAAEGGNGNGRVQDAVTFGSRGVGSASDGRYPAPGVNVLTLYSGLP